MREGVSAASSRDLTVGRPASRTIAKGMLMADDELIQRLASALSAALPTMPPVWYRGTPAKRL